MPKRIGPYLLERELGRGSFAVVYLAKREGLERRVALKVLPYAADEEISARFLREARVTSALHHRNVVGCFDVGRDPDHGWLYLALDYAPGGSLDERLRTGPLPPTQAAAVVAQLADAVAEAHANGILHRDLKPANVLFNAADEPQIADFGLARPLSDPRLTASQDTIGTPAFMAPEQLKGELDDPRIDVYALGGILYQCLTGRPAFNGRTVHEVADAVSRGRFPPPRKVNPAIPASLERICLQALDHDPDVRFPSAVALAEALRAAARPAPVQAGPSPVLLAGVAGLAGLVTLAAIAVVWAVASPATPDVTTPTPDVATPAPTIEPPAPRPPVTPPRELPPREPVSPPPAASRTDELAPAREALDRWAFAAAEAALDDAAGGALPVAEVSELRRRLEEARQEEAEVTARLERRYAVDLEHGAALEEAERALERRPGSANLRRLVAYLSAAHGDYLRAASLVGEAAQRALDPKTAENDRDGKRFFAQCAELAGDRIGEEPWADWIPLQGGAWSILPNGDLRGRALGLGEFGYCGLIHRATGATDGSFTVEVEVELDDRAEQAYAGVVVGLTDVHNTLLVYVLRDLAALDLPRGMSREEAHRRIGGVWPKAVRIARLVRGHWRPLGQIELRFPDTGWVRLQVEVDGSTVRPIVDGARQEALETGRPIRGHVGLLKFYEAPASYRGFKVTRR